MKAKCKIKIRNNGSLSEMEDDSRNKFQGSLPGFKQKGMDVLSTEIEICGQILLVLLFSAFSHSLPPLIWPEKNCCLQALFLYLLVNKIQIILTQKWVLTCLHIFVHQNDLSFNSGSTVFCRVERVSLNRSVASGSAADPAGL